MLAVDLGGSACRAALSEGDVRVGGGSPGLGVPEGAALAEGAVLALVSRWTGDVGVSAAGALAAPGAARELAERLCRSLGARQVAVVSDALASQLGALGGERGVVLAVGTGVVAVAADGQVVDGLGPWLGDVGGGGWLGLAGLRAALGGAAALRAAAEARFGALSALPARMAADANPPGMAAAFAPDVVACAEAGDGVAAGLVDEAVTALARTVRQAGGAPYAVVGGLAPLLRGRIAEALGVVPVAARGTALDAARRIATDTGTVHERHVARSAAAGGLDGLATEGVRAGLEDLDLRPAGEVVRLVLAAERGAQGALARAEPALAAAAEAVAARMLAGGGGTPGRLAALDAAELGPTYSAPPGLVVPLLAGGPGAMLRAAEGAEDDPDAAGAALDAAGLGAGDAVVGITASGRTPYVLGGLRHARERGALTVALVNNAGSECAAAAALAVVVLTGPEVVAGSTRMMAGTVQKVALNALSTAVMAALGKTYGPYMVDVAATNGKLRRRAVRMVQQIAGVEAAAAAAALAASGGRVKPALVALLAGVDVAEAERRLAAAGGRVRAALR